MSTIHVFELLANERAVPGLCVCFGDEPFLKGLARKRLRQLVLADADTPYASFEGSEIQWRDLADELSTVSLFGSGGRRLVFVQQADSFVTQHRGRLEKYADKPRASGVLVLEVDSWASNTRLYGLVDASGLQVECRPPQKAVGKRKVLDESRVTKWVVEWARQQHDARLEPAATRLLLELVGTEFGLLDQELAKLALFAGRGGKVTEAMVRDVVGGWRAKTVWELIDAAADGNAAAALEQLDHSLRAGEHPLAILGQVAWSLRRFAAATRIFQESEQSGRRMPLREALIQAGFPHWNRAGLERAEKQIMQLGRDRAGQLYQWLLETDLALKGTHSSPERGRLALEKLFVRMSRQSSGGSSA